MRRPHQAPCQIAESMRREGEPQGSRCDERDGRGGEEKMAAKAQKYRSHLAWMTAVRYQIAVVETDNMADLVLSQGGTTIANLVRYPCKVGSLGRRYSSLLGAQRCSNLARAQVLPPATGDFDMVNAMTNLVVQAVRKMDLPSWLPLRELSSWSNFADHTTAIRGRLQGFLGAKTKAVTLGVAHGGAVPDTEHAESARWLNALSVESRLLRWIACSDFGLLPDRFIEAKKPWPKNSTFAYWWQTIEDRVLLCVEEVARASTSSHLSCHFGGFMVHRDAPVTSPQQFLDDLATHLRITTLSTTPFDFKEHLSFTSLSVPPNRRTSSYLPRRRTTLVREWCLSPCATALGFTTGLWLAAARAEYCVGLARGRERRGPRERGRHAPGDRFRDPEKCWQLSDPDRHAGPWRGVPVGWLLLQTEVVHS